MSEETRSPPTTPVGDNERLAERLADADGLLVATDFDGTLAPIFEDPETPTITPANRRALIALGERPDVAVAVVSGRRLADLRSRVGIDAARYVGNHGLEVAECDRVATHPAAEELRPALDRASAALEERIGDVPGVEIEDKGATITVHYRRASPRRVEEVASAVTGVVESVDGLRTTSGKQVAEIRPDVDRDKGSAVRELAADVPDGWRTVYVGDDTTDEDVFRVLDPEAGDAGVVVGDRETDATHRVADQRDVSRLLDWLATEALDDRP